MTAVPTEDTRGSIRDSIAGPAFPATNAFSGVNRPMRVEADVYELEYSGTLPAALQGALYRCGPEPQFPPRSGDDIYINGDGMVLMLAFTDGHVDLRTRYVRTEKMLSERRARRALFGGYRNPWTDDPAVEGMDRTTANTNMLWHGGRLFALKEDGLAHHLDPVSLETLGKWTFDGALRSQTTTAHPKVDPVTGELVFFGYAAAGEGSDDIAFCRAAADGTLTDEQWFHPPYRSMLHDWAVSENFVVFPVMPATTDDEVLRAGGPRWFWDDTLRTRIGIVPRTGPVTDVIWVDAPPMWSFHTLNAFDDGRFVHVDLCVAETAPLPRRAGGPPDPQRTRQYLTRWTIDTRAPEPTLTQRRLWDVPVDFPDVDPRVATRAYRRGFLLARDPSRPVHPELGRGVFFNTLAQIDHSDGHVDSWYVGDDRSAQEPVFVARHPDADEGDGYLLSVVNRWPADGCELVVLDTADIAAGPVARIQIPFHLRPSFHGTWVGATELGGLPAWRP